MMMQGISAIVGACRSPMPVHSCTAVQYLSDGQVHAASYLVSCHSRPSSACRELAVAFNHPVYKHPRMRNHLLTTSSIQHLREVSASAGDVEKVESFDAPLTEDEVETAAGLALEEDSSVTTIVGPQVKVKFVLQKECQFGQRFNVVGNDPLLGNWNVEAAVAMNWEDEHIWSAELDIPVGKQVEFKFVLTGKNNEVEWQPGSNRYFETKEDISPLVVAESWDFVDATSEEATADEVSPLATEALESADETRLMEETGESGRDAPASTEAVSADTGATSLGEILVKTGHDNVENETPSEDASDSSNNSPEVPLAELDIAATAVKAAMGIKRSA